VPFLLLAPIAFVFVLAVYAYTSWKYPEDGFLDVK
jgi:hypothetical protein